MGELVPICRDKQVQSHVTFFGFVVRGKSERPIIVFHCFDIEPTGGKDFTNRIEHFVSFRLLGA